MFTKKWINQLCSLLWVLALMFSPVQAVYAAPVGAIKTTPSLLQFTSAGHILGFTSTGMLAATGNHALRVDFVDANPVQPQSDTPASFTGTPQKGQDWITPLGQVTYTDLWDGISLDYVAASGSVYTITYHISPGANPADIRLRYNIPLALNRDGSLCMIFETGTLSESAPVAWQQINGRRVPVQVSFQIQNGQQVGFSLGTYDPAYALTITPSLVWNTFLGGSGVDEEGWGIAMDGSGYIYVTGYSDATWGAPLHAFSGNYDAYVAKLNPSGTLVWNTFSGGSGNEGGEGIAVDGSGNIFVTGWGTATWGTPVRAFSASYDTFVAKLNSSGTLLWNTFLGSSGSDSGVAIDLDGSGNVFVTGSSSSTWGTPLHAFNASYDAFVAKLTPSGALVWNTFYGGSGYDGGKGIVVDSSGDVDVTGFSDATWGAPLASYSSGRDSFIVKLSPSGALVWNTFIGGSGDDETYGIALDGSGNMVVTGYSTGTWGAPLRMYSGGRDAFVAKLNASGALSWNTFLGGSQDDEGWGVAVDGSSNIYVTGKSRASWGAPVWPYHADYDAFAAKLNPSGGLQTNAFLGSAGIDEGQAIAVNGSDNVVVTGLSHDTWGTPLRTFSTGYDTFVAKVDFAFPTVLSSKRASPNPGSATSVNFTVTFSKAVTGVDKTDFTLTTTGVTGAFVSSVSGSGATYTVAVNTGSGNGTLRLNVIDDDSIIDSTGNPLGGSGNGNGNFTGGETYTINKPPAAATLVSPLATVTTAKPTFIWSKVANATLYRLWVKNSSSAWIMQNLYNGANICGASNCAVTPTTSLVNGVYTWYIQTLTATQNGTWSAHSFTVAIPAPGKVTLVAPKGTIHSAKPTFIWSKDPVATLYRLWIKNSSGTWVIQNLYAGKNICGATNCAIVSPVTLANGTYTWYIDTLTATQNGQWSAQAITVSVPDVLPSPSSNDGGEKQ